MVEATLAKRHMAAQDLAQHLVKVKERLVEEDLSVLELRLRGRELMEEHNDEEKTQEVRDMALQEALLVDSMVKEQQASEPTPLEVADIMESNGQPVQAETLRHQIGLDTARREIEQARTNLALTVEEGTQSTKWLESEQARIDALQLKFDELPKLPPVHQRQIEAEALRVEANAKRDAVIKLGEDLPPELQAEADTLQEQSDELFQQAVDLASFVPEPTDAATTESQSGDGDTSLTPFERAQLLRTGQRRGAAA